jgi:hypothetical protein
MAPLGLLDDVSMKGAKGVLINKVHVGIAQVLPQHSSIGQCLLRLAGISHEKVMNGTALNETALLTYQSL